MNVRGDKITNMILKILIYFEGLNFSFDATLVMYINKISKPPIIIKNNIYENHIRCEINPHKRAIIITWKKIVTLMDTGWERNKKINEIYNIIKMINEIQRIV